MTGTITPHGTVNVFDVSLTTAVAGQAPYGTGNVPAGTIYKGILFQTSAGSSENFIEIVATAGTAAYTYIGVKSN
jgi:hypothetical protein